RANSFRFFSVKVPLKVASLEEKNHREVESNLRFAVEEGRENEALYWNLFDFFDVVVKNSSKTW
ncbi:MAG: hypothetical protein LBK74_03740, partial [Treponema sp.]|nr:hypothetical protein [Treponema sp.]